jgi:uncharacterized protein (DUF433 family)
MKDDDALITKSIELNPDKPGLDQARLKEYGVAVWALVAYCRAANGDLDQVVQDYEIPREQVEAALAYYRRHRTLVDARVAINNGDVFDILRPSQTGVAAF